MGALSVEGGGLKSARYGARRKERRWAAQGGCRMVEVMVGLLATRSGALGVNCESSRAPRPKSSSHLSPRLQNAHGLTTSESDIMAAHQNGDGPQGSQGDADLAQVLTRCTAPASTSS